MRRSFSNMHIIYKFVYLSGVSGRRVEQIRLREVFGVATGQVGEQRVRLGLFHQPTHPEFQIATIITILEFENIYFFFINFFVINKIKIVFFGEGEKENRVSAWQFDFCVLTP